MVHFETKTTGRNEARATIETENFSVIIDVNFFGVARKARVYVSGEEEVDFTEAYALQEAHGYQARGVYPDEDKLFDRLNRQVVKNRKAVIEVAKAEVPELAAILGDVKLTFSRKAGCSCGCSPAFVPSRHLFTAGTYTTWHSQEVKEATGMFIADIFVTAKK